MQVCLSGAFRYGQQLSAVERVFTAHNLLVAASENPLRATTINDCAKLGTALGGTPTIVERLPNFPTLRSPCSPRAQVFGFHANTIVLRMMPYAATLTVMLVVALWRRRLAMP